MIIEKNRVVTIDYELKDDQGEVLDSSSGSEPLVYLHGNQNIIPGLEKHLAGKKAGDSIDCLVPAAEAYGLHDDSLVIKVKKDEFGPGAQIEPGMQFEAQGHDGAQIVTVIGVEGDEVTIDANHPLAGEDLHFAVKVVDVREASAEELEHGHVHAACGCGCGEDDECGCGDEGSAEEGGCGCGRGGCCG